MDRQAAIGYGNGLIRGEFLNLLADLRRCYRGWQYRSEPDRDWVRHLGRPFPHHPPVAVTEDAPPELADADRYDRYGPPGLLEDPLEAALEAEHVAVAGQPGFRKDADYLPIVERIRGCTQCLDDPLGSDIINGNGAGYS